MTGATPLIRYNESHGFGGGIYFHPGSGGAVRSQIHDSTLAFNEALGEGGGLAMDAGGTPALQLLNSTISGNHVASSPTVPGIGGGICIIQGDIELNRVTIEANTAEGDGTQIFVKSDSTVTDVNATIIDGAPNVCAGMESAIRGGNNLWTDGSCTDLSGIKAPALLKPLDDYGGYCGGAHFPCLTHKPDVSSPAINGSPACITEDQRHYPRGPSPCWIGAYED